jgi:hypothetical protein
MHPTASALITCLLFGLKDSRHLHFIDGSDGGFTIAARHESPGRGGVRRCLTRPSRRTS